MVPIRVRGMMKSAENTMLILCSSVDGRSMGSTTIPEITGWKTARNAMVTEIMTRRIEMSTVTGTSNSLARRPTTKLTVMGRKMMLNPISPSAKGEYSEKNEMKKKVAMVTAPQKVQRRASKALWTDSRSTEIWIHSQRVEVAQSVDRDKYVEIHDLVSQVPVHKRVILPIIGIGRVQDRKLVLSGYRQ